MPADRIPTHAACPACGVDAAMEQRVLNQRTGEVNVVTFRCPQHGPFRFMARSGMVVLDGGVTGEGARRPS